ARLSQSTAATATTTTTATATAAAAASSSTAASAAAPSAANVKWVVLISTGAYNPPHRRHIEVFRIAKDALEATKPGATGMVTRVLAAFISPSHDSYLRSKLRAQF